MDTLLKNVDFKKLEAEHVRLIQQRQSMLGKIDEQIKAVENALGIKELYDREAIRARTKGCSTPQAVAMVNFLEAFPLLGLYYGRETFEKRMCYEGDEKTRFAEAKELTKKYKDLLAKTEAFIKAYLYPEPKQEVHRGESIPTVQLPNGEFIPHYKARRMGLV